MVAFLKVVFMVSVLALLLLAEFGDCSKVLVTGGAGFIGYHTSIKLKETGAEVIVLDNFNDEYEPNLKKTRAKDLKERGVTVLEGSSSDIHIIEYIFRHHSDLTAVVHCAAYSNPKGNSDNPIRGISDNVESLVNVLDIITKQKDPQVRLVYLSSADVYSTGDTLPFNVESQLSLPSRMIGAMKMSGESLISGYAVSKGLKAVSLRLFSVYGPWDKPGSIIYDLTNAINGDQSVEIPYEGDTPLSRDFVYIDDVVQGIIGAIKYEGSGHTIFNIATGTSVPLTTVTDMLKEEFSKESVKTTKKSISFFGVLDSYGDITKTKNELSWTPQTTLKDGIKKFVEWFKNKKISAQSGFEAIKGKAFDEYIDTKNAAFIKRIGDLREKYTEYAKAHNIPVARFYRNKTFLFFPGVDSGRNRRRASGPVENMKKTCNLIDECVAFNANGEMKGIIDLKSRWGRGSGLYVADIDVCQAGLHNCFGNSTCTYKGPAQFECGCKEGFGMYAGHCIELYIEGKVSQSEADEKLADYIDGRDWAKYVGDKAGKYIQFTNKDEHVADGALLYYPAAKGNVEKLKDACNKSYHCVGFSTSGILKRSVDQPSSWRYSGDSMYLLDVDYCSLEAFRCRPNAHCRKDSPGRYSC